jgi:hypothetical protein
MSETDVKVIKCPELLATEHWEWVVVWLELIYKDAFVHGYKHGREDRDEY